MVALFSLMDRESQISSSSPSSPANATANVIGRHSMPGMLVAWIVLQLAGQVTLPILVFTMIFSKRIARRNPTVINLCTVWAVSTIPPLMLFYVGQHQGPQPNKSLCLLQAATISAVAPMAAMAYFSVVIHASLVIYEILNDIRARAFTLNFRMVFLLGSPYVTFFIFAFSIAYIGAENANDVGRTQLFCTVGNHHISIPVFTFTSVIVLLTLICQLWICVVCYRDYSNKRKSFSGRTAGSGLRNALSSFDLTLLLRMVAFTIFEIILIGSSIVSIFSPRLHVPQLLLATPPFAVFLIFATSQDIFSVWLPCIFRNKSTFKQIRESQDLLRDERYSQRSRQSMSALSQYDSQSGTISSAMYSSEKLVQSGTGVGMSMKMDIEKGITTPAAAYSPPQRYGENDHAHNTLLSAQEFGGSGTVVHSTSSQMSPLDVIRAFRTSPMLKPTTGPRPSPGPRR